MIKLLSLPAGAILFSFIGWLLFNNMWVGAIGWVSGWLFAYFNRNNIVRSALEQHNRGNNEAS